MEVSFDFAKAFDIVSAPTLLNSKKRGCTLNWFSRYLKERRQGVKVENLSSGTQVVYYKVTQGSILGPTRCL